MSLKIQIHYLYFGSLRHRCSRLKCLAVFTMAISRKCLLDILLTRQMFGWGHWATSLGAAEIWGLASAADGGWCHNGAGTTPFPTFLLSAAFANRTHQCSVLHWNCIGVQYLTNHMILDIATPAPQPLIVTILRKWTLMKKKRRFQHWSPSMPMKRTRRWHFSPSTKCFTSKSTTSLRFVKNTLELQQIELQQEHFFPCAPLSRSLGMSQTRFEMRTNF